MIDKQQIMDSLTKEQRVGIAKIIRGADIDYDIVFPHGWWERNGEDSVNVESAHGTLKNLANYFESYEPDSAIQD